MSTGATRAERGSATAETAIALPVVVIVLLAIGFAASAGLAQLRCADAARVAARSIAIGASTQEASSHAMTSAGGEASVTASLDGEWVTITVTRTLSTPWGSTLSVSATSVARREPGVAANASEVDLPTRDWQMGDWQTGARQTGNWQAGDWHG